MDVYKSIFGFFFSLLLCLSSGYVESSPISQTKDDEWPIVTVYSDIDQYIWYYEKTVPETWLLSSDKEYIAEDGTSDEGVRAVVYSDHIRKLVYPRIVDAYNEYAVPIDAEKTSICGVSSLAIVLKIFLIPRNSARAASYDGPLYGYERIFLNLERERQSVQIDDDYSTRKAKSNVPLAEFLEVKKFTCEDNFIVFPDSDNGDT